jgi:hypothetical protein
VDVSQIRPWRWYGSGGGGLVDIRLKRRTRGENSHDTVSLSRVNLILCLCVYGDCLGLKGISSKL